MYFTAETLATNSRLRGHWNELWANRDIWNAQHDMMVNAFRGQMSPEMLAANAIGGLTHEFWVEIDRQIIQMRDQEEGMEIINDLASVQTILPIGKTVKAYQMIGDIADDVAISIDGQAPYSFDHSEYDSDGDPVPVFTAGFGVNWRHAAGLNTVGIDAALDAQSAKMSKFHRARVGYYLNGNDRISVDGKKGQGFRNHRNTVKINLGTGAGGANIDLTTATPAQLLAFFGSTGAFGIAARANKVAAYDVLWISSEIWANMSKPYLVDINAGTNALLSGTVADAISKFIPAKSIRSTFALKGNEFFGYQRRKDVISPLVGMAVGTIPLPRNMPQSNYIFQIMSAEGLQIKRDGDGLSGVIYGANLAQGGNHGR
ncbi:hypothetical protein GWD52_21150 [Enterobacteriaceae bacterium 4M9]|nr:hypothetical protein [Enterobacteriaceae bacterium 4M9]